MARALMVIAPKMFRDEEYEVPRHILEASGVEVTVASTRAGTCTGKLGAVANADVALSDALGTPWDAVVFVGGPGASVFFDDPIAHEIARSAAVRGAVVSAICIAPSTLAHAGLLTGRRATAFPSQEDDLVRFGAIWTGEPVTLDGRIITANGPEAAEEFGQALARALA